MKLLKRCKNLFYVCLTTAVISSCVKPLLAIGSEIKVSESEPKTQIQTYNGKNRIMQYASSGDPKKRPVLFVHGSPGSWKAWANFLLNSDLQKKFHLIAVDRPGYGGSEPGVTVTSIAIQAADVMEVLNINKSHLPAILVGHSFGGPVIAKAAIDFTEQVAGLVFVASSVSPDLEKTKWYQYPATWWPIRILIPTELRVCNEEIMQLKSELQLMRPQWKSIKAKSILIQGEEDGLVPAENLDFLIEHLDKKSIIDVVRIKDMNHFVPWQRPELIIEGINKVNHAL